MRDKYRTVLYINLTDRKYEFKTHSDLRLYIGGIGIGYKLFYDNFDRAKCIIATGPLSGLFPYVSKAAFLYKTDINRIEERFGGGSIASLMNLVGIDAIVITGETYEALNISISVNEVRFSSRQGDPALGYVSPNLLISRERVTSDGYFSFGNFDSAVQILFDIAININSTEEYDIADYYGYVEKYEEILNLYTELEVEPRNNPSCFGCPIGCDLSSLGEDKSNSASVLTRCLVGCAYANEIYKEVPIVYACLTSIGYNYYHSDLTKISDLVGELKKEIVSKYLLS